MPCRLATQMWQEFLKMACFVSHLLTHSYHSKCACCLYLWLREWCVKGGWPENHKRNVIKSHPLHIHLDSLLSIQCKPINNYLEVNTTKVNRAYSHLTLCRGLQHLNIGNCLIQNLTFPLPGSALPTVTKTGFQDL